MITDSLPACIKGNHMTYTSLKEVWLLQVQDFAISLQVVEHNSLDYYCIALS